MQTNKKTSISNIPSILRDKTFLMSLGTSIFFLLVSLVISHFAGLYADSRASSTVTDIFLSNVRAYDVDAFFIYGPFLFWIYILIVSLRRASKIPFTIYSIALFVVVRSVFISLTHLGPIPTEALTESSNILSRFSLGNDYFFSGHTGLPFLMALVFWDIKSVRYVCIASSVFFGLVVLFGHYHYSIDVLSAFFITYSIYKIAEVIFKKEKEFLHIK